MPGTNSEGAGGHLLQLSRRDLSDFNSCSSCRLYTCTVHLTYCIPSAQLRRAAHAVNYLPNTGPGDPSIALSFSNAELAQRAVLAVPAHEAARLFEADAVEQRELVAHGLLHCDVARPVGHGLPDARVYGVISRVHFVLGCGGQASQCWLRV